MLAHEGGQLNSPGQPLAAPPVHLSVDCLASFLQWIFSTAEKGTRMRIHTQPSRRAGASKCIFSGPLQIDSVHLDGEGEVKICLTADDIYTKKSRQRYVIALTREEVMLLGAAALDPVQDNRVS